MEAGGRHSAPPVALRSVQHCDRPATFSPLTFRRSMHTLRSSAFVAVAVIVAMLASPLRLHAQFPPNVQAGARVRAWLPEDRRQAEGRPHRLILRGTVESVAGDTIRIAIPGTAGAVAVPRASLRRLDISRGEPLRGESALERAVGGAVGGAIIMALMNDPRRTGGPSYRTDWRAAGVGAAWGAGIGAVVGFILPQEQWRRLHLPR